MTYKYKKTYQSDQGLQEAIVDLVRIGTDGYASGVRQVANRLIKALPPGISDAGAFRDALHDALAESPHGVFLDQLSIPKQAESDGVYPLVELDYPADGDGLILNETQMRQLREIVRERENAQLLRAEGVGLTRSILLSGPPGVGKTMAAHWLASNIGVPLLTLSIPAVISRFLGNSGRNVKSVLDFAKSGQCVLLIDEFDALAKQRNDESDIGELKRIVNVVLMELDRWPDASLLVAATNHDQLLDPAIHRRFDRRIKIELPSKLERRSILNGLAFGKDDVDDCVLDIVAITTEGMTGSDLTRLWKLARRRSLLNARSTASELCLEIAETRPGPGVARDELWLLLSERAGMSLRQIAELVGVSHPTVFAAIKRAKGRR